MASSANRNTHKETTGQKDRQRMARKRTRADVDVGINETRRDASRRRSVSPEATFFNPSDPLPSTTNNRVDGSSSGFRQALAPLPTPSEKRARQRQSASAHAPVAASAESDSNQAEAEVRVDDRVSRAGSSDDEESQSDEFESDQEGESDGSDSEGEVESWEEMVLALDKADQLKWAPTKVNKLKSPFLHKFMAQVPMMTYMLCPYEDVERVIFLGIKAHVSSILMDKPTSEAIQDLIKEDQRLKRSEASDLKLWIYAANLLRDLSSIFSVIDDIIEGQANHPTEKFCRPSGEWVSALEVIPAGFGKIARSTRTAAVSSVKRSYNDIFDRTLARNGVIVPEDFEFGKRVANGRYKSDVIASLIVPVCDWAEFVLDRETYRRQHLYHSRNTATSSEERPPDSRHVLDDFADHDSDGDDLREEDEEEVGIAGRRPGFESFLYARPSAFRERDPHDGIFRSPVLLQVLKNVIKPAGRHRGHPTRQETAGYRGINIRIILYMYSLVRHLTSEDTNFGDDTAHGQDVVEAHHRLLDLWVDVLDEDRKSKVLRAFKKHLSLR